MFILPTTMENRGNFNETLISENLYNNKYYTETMAVIVFQGTPKLLFLVTPRRFQLSHDRTIVNVGPCNIDIDMAHIPLVLKTGFINEIRVRLFNLGLFRNRNTWIFWKSRSFGTYSDSVLVGIYLLILLLISKRPE